MRVTNPYSENEIPDQSIRMLAKKIKSAIREKLRLDPDNIVIEGYYKSGLSKSLPIGIHFPIPKGTEWPWTSIKEELFKSINEILEDSGLGKHIDDPDVLRGQYRLSLSKASPKEGSVLIEVWPREIEKIRLNPRPVSSRWVEFGTKVEMEHTKNKKIARKIALDHLKESPNYYKDWKKKEKILFKSRVKNPGAHFKDDDFRVDTWFERDRAYVGLVNIATNETVVEWWDDQVHEAIEDGFLDPRNYKKSALEYAKSMNLIWGEIKPMKKLNPYLKKFGIAFDRWEEDKTNWAFWIPEHDEYSERPFLIVDPNGNEDWDIYEKDRANFFELIYLGKDNEKNAYRQFRQVLEKIKAAIKESAEKRRNPKKILKAHRQRISMKIKKLMKEGMKQKQAVATALSMQRAGRLGPRGGYRKNPVGGISHTSIAKIARVYNGKIHFVEQEIMIFSFEDMSLAKGFIEEVSAIPTVQTYKDSIGGAALVLVFLKNHGQFQKNPIKNELMAEALAALAGLLKYPERSEDVREEVLAALEAEGYWNVDRGVTEKGRKFLEEICSLEDLPE